MRGWPLSWSRKRGEVRTAGASVFTMNSPKQHQHQQQRVSELRMRRWAGRNQHAAATGGNGGSPAGSELELSFRSGSLNTSFSTSETVVCETPVSSTGGGRADSIISSEFEFCRPRSSNNSRSASPLLRNSPSPCPPSPSSRTPRSPRSPRSPMTPCSPSSGSSPQPGVYSSSRRRSGAVTGNLARLASRRSSRDSEAGEPSPLQCSRFSQRRTSNFLEIPGESVIY